MSKDPCRLYLITPPAFAPDAFAPLLAEALEGGDVAALQLRLKDTDDAAILRAAEALMPLCQAREVAFLINDRPDLAVKAGADGVHIGAEDGDYRSARETVGGDGIVGVSCYDSRHAAIVAAEAGADYVAFGAFFQTATKTPRARVPISVLDWWSKMTVVPCVAIGGITQANCPPLVKAGADFLAVISAVWDHPAGPKAAVAEFNAAIAQASRG
jgi:thiamine-phosphate pyrophosphorylase